MTANGFDVHLGWQNPIDSTPYDTVEILRDGVVLGQASEATSMSFVDEDVPSGEHTYEIVATFEATPCGGVGVPSCHVTVPSEAPRVDWVREAKLTGPVGAPRFPIFGASIRVDGDRMLVGHGLDGENSFVWVFEYSAGRWEEVGRIFDPAGGRGPNAFALDGERALIGSAGEDHSGLEKRRCGLRLGTSGRKLGGGGKTHRERCG